jgi:hypothetical protein
MGSVNSMGVYEYDRTDGGIGPTLLNLQASALTAVVSGMLPIKAVATTAARATHLTAYVAARGAITSVNPCVVWRADAPAGSNIEYTVDGSTWETLTPSPTSAALTAETGWTVSANAIKNGGVVRISGTLTRSGANISLTTSWTKVATVPAGYRPSDIFIGVTLRTTQPLELQVNSSGEVFLRVANGTFTFVSTLSVYLSPLGAWPLA